LGDTATVVAGNRGLDARRLTQLLAADLDWVVMKALEKDRNRRYDTPGGLAEDIERYLSHEAIQARPPSKTYRFKKLVRRNRAAMLTAAVVAGALLAGTAVSTWQALRARRAERAALTAAHAEFVAAQAEREAKEEALAREAETKAVLAFVVNRIFVAARPEQQAGGLGRAVTLRKAIESALPYVNKSFPNQPLIEAKLRVALGVSFFFLGDARTAAELEEEARALYTKHRGADHPDTLMAMNNLANSYEALGRASDALKLREETLALRKARLGADHPDTLGSMNNLALSYKTLGRLGDALKLYEETLALRKAKLGADHSDTLETMNNLAECYQILGRLDDALKLREETLALRKTQLGADHPDTLASMNNLAISYATSGRRAEAVPLFEQALALQNAKLGPDHPDTLASMNNLANSYHALGRNAEALKLREETVALQKAKFGADHPRTLTSMNNLALSYYALGRFDAALKLHEETLTLQKATLGANHPDTFVTMCGMAESLVAVHRGAEAVPIIDECVQRAAGKTVDPHLLPLLIDLRLRHFEALKDAAGCRQTAAMWDRLKRTDVESLYQSACYRSVTAAVLRAADESASAAHQADAEADGAMTWLKQAVAGGYKDATQIKKDNDLDSLRAREDFKKLIAELDRLSKR
jgi:hypothetical protein